MVEGDTVAVIDLVVLAVLFCTVKVVPPFTRFFAATVGARASPKARLTELVALM